MTGIYQPLEHLFCCQSLNHKIQDFPLMVGTFKEKPATTTTNPSSSSALMNSNKGRQEEWKIISNRCNRNIVQKNMASVPQQVGLVTPLGMQPSQVDSFIQLPSMVNCALVASLEPFVNSIQSSPSFASIVAMSLFFFSAKENSSSKLGHSRSPQRSVHNGPVEKRR